MPFFIYFFLKEGYSALAWSAKQGHDEIVKKLIAKGAYYNLTDKVTQGRFYNNLAIFIMCD